MRSPSPPAWLSFRIDSPSFSSFAFSFSCSRSLSNHSILGSLSKTNPSTSSCIGSAAGADVGRIVSSSHFYIFFAKSPFFSVGPTGDSFFFAFPSAISHRPIFGIRILSLCAHGRKTAHPDAPFPRQIAHTAFFFLPHPSKPEDWSSLLVCSSCRGIQSLGRRATAALSFCASFYVSFSGRNH